MPRKHSYWRWRTSILLLLAILGMGWQSHKQIKALSIRIDYLTELDSTVAALMTDNNKMQIWQVVNATVYGYSSTEEQTDDTPYLTAANTKVREGIVANNCLAFGTWVEIAGKQYQVADRMNYRYGCAVFDLWFPTERQALNWGKQSIEVKILK